MYLTQNLHNSIQQTPDKVATVFQGRQRTFAEIGERVARFAAGLRALGLQAGDRISMLALNSDWYLEYYLATYWAGGVVNPINTRWSVEEISYALNDCGSRFLIVDDTFIGVVDELRSQCPELGTVIHVGDGPPPGDLYSWETLVADNPPAEDALRGGDDLAGIYYTSGTTGKPKGAMLSHGNIFINAVGMAAEGLVRRGYVGLHSAPMFHLADGAFMNAMFSVGGCHVMVPAFEPVSVLQTIAQERVSAMLLVPTMIQMLVDHPERGNYDLSSVHSVMYGASPIAEGLLDRAMAAFPSAGFAQAYGMTELSPVATVLTAEMHREEGRKTGRHRSNGRAMVTAEVRIVDEHDNELPRGQVGEIVSRGPHVMLGYWNKPEATAEAIRDGWMHTGDGGWMDEAGFVFVADRIKDMIITGGENVYSLEVENCLASHPAVAQAAVVAIPSEQWGEAVHAFVVRARDASVSAEELMAHCKQHIAGYKCPRSVDFIDAMPLSGAGKVLKRQLRAPFWVGHTRNVE